MRLEGGDDEARVAEDGGADAEEWDAAIGDTEGGEVRAGEDAGLEALGVRDLAEGEVPGEAPRIGGVGVVEEDDVVRRRHGEGRSRVRFLLWILLRSCLCSKL